MARKLNIGELLLSLDLGNTICKFEANTRKFVGDYSVNVKQKSGDYEISLNYDRNDVTRSIKYLEDKGLNNTGAYFTLLKLEKAGMNEVEKKRILDRNSAKKDIE